MSASAPDWDGGGGVAGLEGHNVPPQDHGAVGEGRLAILKLQLANFWGGNALRVLGKAYAASKAQWPDAGCQDIRVAHFLVRAEGRHRAAARRTDISA